MEDEWEEEEQLVVAELSGVIDSDVLCKRGGVCKMVGMSSEQPMLQVGRYVFAGEYEDALGTCVIFEEQANDRPKSSSSPVLRYKCHTMKKLMLQRTFLSERKDGEASSGGIEVLSLNEGEVCGRSSTVCHYGLDPKELQRLNAGEDISDESDTEKAETQQSPVKETADSVLEETRENLTH
ncbi:general transcription factor 3C polypeptide 6 [Pangasianodon hypophthalmus]|uniref:general transcription factor 3C polypeptide 6 n=1 Tax=Pangasianodon hypophthalmus TaxID=310915 RepID=UPI000EFF5398|nr:general transcription factor 3C polypeptide 6 [Pangasianodon hypophthalmus]